MAVDSRITCEIFYTLLDVEAVVVLLLCHPYYCVRVTNNSLNMLAVVLAYPVIKVYHIRSNIGW